MKKLLFLYLLTPFLVRAQVTLVVNNAFQLTPLEDTLFLAGSMNNWTENDINYRFQRIDFNTFQITFIPPVGQVNYKITRGNWDKVESNANGTYLPDRIINYTGSPITQNIQIDGWEDIGGINQSSASDNTHLIDLDFFIPTLNRTRRVWVYLPPDYHTSTKNYPVVYMQDAQNLFDQAYAPFGEWEVDETMNDLFYNQGDYGAIVIGIDHGNVDRINEYSPWVNSSYGGGQGDEYMDFLAQTLVPYVDNHFRTVADPNYRGLIGSSMGGLISQYGVIEHSNTFRKGGIMSPAFWFSGDLFDHVHTQGIHPDMKFYFMSGTNESSSMVPLMIQMQDSLLSLGLNGSRIRLETHSDGQHSEWFWAREFGGVYTWLFNDLQTMVKASDTNPNSLPLKLFPNPSNGSFTLENTKSEDQIEVYNALQQLVLRTSAQDHQTQIHIDKSSGIYFVKVRSNNQVFQEKVFIR